jgi:amidase
MIFDDSFRGFKIPEGWSGVGGQTFCPYNASAGPSGSSSGSAVAVAANLATVALGSETDGSIAAPAARQALFGLKPTKGLVSTKGVIPLSFSQDVVPFLPPANRL